MVVVSSAAKALGLEMVTYGLKAVPFCAVSCRIIFQTRDAAVTQTLKGQGKGKKRGSLSTSAVVRAFG